MIDIRKATESDVVAACASAREVYKGETQIVQTSLADIKHGPAFSLFDDRGLLIGIVGGIFVWDGVARVWAVTTGAMDLYPVACGRLLTRLLTEAVAGYNIHRLEMTVKVGFQPGVRLAKFLGFEVEGLLRQYGPDKSDYYIMGRLSS